ncbi:MAG: ABC transporter ATP-binding protein [Bacteroidota bacterium]|nr:ABC transporter ATP-binding protein [Bacteroidota bacterium]
MKPILEIQKISKKFRINSQQQPYLSIRDSVANAFKGKSKTEDFWALKDVSFNVEQGDTIGIIGKNGAGKSTLLKILSKITPPTSGKIIGRGRIASLLEVGTGFHPELSGRENIFMNGSILGMKRVEIQKNFEAIVDFAGIDKFIDTPLKHYSSGMQLRLAFAVAAFLENEILIIDEVLAVGDAEFQKKCMGKMEDVSKSGRTILFVSHQLSSIESLCKKCVVLNKGKIFFEGNTADAINNYVSLNNNSKSETETNDLIKEIKITSLTSGLKSILPFDSISITGKIILKELIKNPVVGIVIRNVFNIPVIGINNKTYGVEFSSLKNNYFEIKLDNVPLIPGFYTVDFYIGDGIVDHYKVENLIVFEVSDELIFQNGKNPESKVNSFVLQSAEWHISDV